MVMSRFEFHPTPLSGLMVVQRKPIEDNRGFFARFFCADEFRQAGFTQPIAQINQTLTYKKGAVRGLHFQRPPHAEVKIVSCLKGDIFDVAIDLRRGSPTFLKWHGEVLTAQNRKSLLIPEGFAHGFQTLTDDAEVLYMMAEPYHAESARGVRWDDPAFGIDWPIANPAMSERDRTFPLFKG